MKVGLKGMRIKVKLGINGKASERQASTDSVIDTMYQLPFLEETFQVKPVTE